MDRRFIEAAREGDVEKLHNLIKNEPFALRAMALTSGDTPLHVACIAGHAHFVKEIINLEPKLATELNQDGFGPLHIASASGNIDIVKELLKLGHHLCLVKGKEKRIALHQAVAKGRIKVIRELISVRPDSIAEVSGRGENCFHLAVKNSQFESFKVLAEHVVKHEKEDVLNNKDQQGNTILHLAASRKQYEVIDLLLDKNFGYKNKLEINSLNKKGLTPLDVLVSEGDDSDINEMLTQAGAIRSLSLSPQNLSNASQDPSDDDNIPPEQQEQRKIQSKSPSKKLQEYFKYDNIRESPSKVRNMLLVITVLIATATYQAVLSPPGGVWQDDFWPDQANKTSTNVNSSAKQPPSHTAGKSVMGTHNVVSYGMFLVFNSLGFFMSLHMMNFLTLGLPLQFELRVALCALIATYDTCMVAITPGATISLLFTIVSIVMPIMMPILTKVVRDYKKGRRSVSPCTGETA